MIAHKKRYDICVIGAGSGGLVVAAGASQMGANVALIEADKMGGDCLNYGCVPSKALIAAAHSAETIRQSQKFGITSTEPQIDMKAVAEHIKNVIGQIAVNDSVERFSGLGVDVYLGTGTITDKHTVSVGEDIIKARYIVIATGSQPLVPPIKGLADVPFFTNETIFHNEKKIQHLLVMGGGPIGSEIAQSYKRLGSNVTIVDMLSIISKDDPEAVNVLRQQFIHEGINLYEYTKVVSIEKSTRQIILNGEKDGKNTAIKGSHLLVAVGRRPNTKNLGLENVGIECNKGGTIPTDERLRTSAKNIFAIGDVTGPYQFTHMAGYQAGVVIRNILFKIPAKVNYAQVPWATYTSPEIAHVGMTEKDVEEKLGPRNYHVLRWPLHENDRAVAENATHGFVKAITDKRGTILGATVVGEHAGDHLATWNIAVANKLKVSHITNTILPYPTLSEASKRAASSYYTPKIFSERVQKIVRFLVKI